jgi:hypothetical protein
MRSLEIKVAGAAAQHVPKRVRKQARRITLGSMGSWVGSIPLHVTSAMEAGIADHVWSLQEIMALLN